jgi:signal transduction histidine kinase
MIVVFFIYGLSFCALGLGLFLYPKKESRYRLSKDVNLIATFAVLHAFNEWIDMFILIYEPMDLPALKVTGMILLPLSFFFLAKFGIKHIFENRKGYSVLRFLPVALLIAWGVIGLLNEHRLYLCEIWSRYLLGSSGIFLTSYALFSEAFKLKDEKRPEAFLNLLLSSTAFFLYGIFSALSVPEAGFFPASYLNYTFFLDKVGIPVQCFRAVCAVLIAVNLTRVLRIFHIEFREELRKSREELMHTNESLEVSQEMLRTLMSKMSLIEEHERKTISEELHDNIGQYLALSKIKVSTLRESHPAIAKDLDEIQELIVRLIKYTRSLTYDLANPVLYQMGLQSAVKGLIERLEEKHDIEVELNCDESSRNPDEESSIILFRAIRELLTNIIKHANAKRAKVSMSSNEDSIEVTVEDDGTGFDYSQLESYSIEKQSMGLFNIRERMKYLGGTFDLVSEKGKGTRVTINVPEHKPAH